MLILDKHKAVERMVALTAQHEPAANLPDDEAPHGRRRQRVATFERRAGARADAADAPRRRRVPAVGAPYSIG